MLTFIDLGYMMKKTITVKGLEAGKNADAVYAEFYTSNLIGTSIEKIENSMGRRLIILSREEVELEPDLVMTGNNRNVVFLSGGDAMFATTHIDLPLTCQKMLWHRNLDHHAPSTIQQVSVFKRPSKLQVREIPTIHSLISGMKIRSVIAEAPYIR